MLAIPSFCSSEKFSRRHEGSCERDRSSHCSIASSWPDRCSARHNLPTRCSRRPHSQRFPILPSAHARFLPRPNEGSANGANAKPTGLPASVSHQGRICAAGNRSWHCELNPVGRAVVVHSGRLRRRSGFGGLAALLTVATDGPQGVRSHAHAQHEPLETRRASDALPFRPGLHKRA